jgi:hypothetical protein
MHFLDAPLGQYGGQSASDLHLIGSIKVGLADKHVSRAIVETNMKYLIILG